MKVKLMCRRFLNFMEMRNACQISFFYVKTIGRNGYAADFFVYFIPFLLKNSEKVLWNKTKPVPLRTKIWIYY